MSDYVSQHHKEYTMHAKLSEKNVKQLANSSEVDADLGIALPADVTKDVMPVKDEFPSHQPLQKAFKSSRLPCTFTDSTSIETFFV